MSRIDPQFLFEGGSLEDALSRARDEGRSLVAIFFAAWCLPSHRLLSSLGADRDAVAHLRERAVVLRLDGEEHSELRERYGVEVYPTLLVLSSAGIELGRSVGHAEPDELLERVGLILAARSAPAAALDSDPVNLVRRSRRLAESGAEGEALAVLLTVFADLTLPDRLRLAFVPQEIAELGRAYAPALEALRTERDRREEALGQGTAAPREAAEYVALNEALNEPRRSLPVFDRLAARGVDAVTRACAERLVALLLAEGRYQDLHDHAGRNAWYFRREMARAARGGEAWWARFLIEASCCYETALALGHDVEAREIADAAIACLPTLQTFATLLDAALASERAAVARELLARAREELDGSDARRLERRLASA